MRCAASSGPPLNSADFEQVAKVTQLRGKQAATNLGQPVGVHRQPGAPQRKIGADLQLS
jgi:hypothetical protein